MVPVSGSCTASLISAGAEEGDITEILVVLLDKLVEHTNSNQRGEYKRQSPPAFAARRCRAHAEDSN